jgi:hypothetical protein
MKKNENNILYKGFTLEFNRSRKESKLYVKENGRTLKIIPAENKFEALRQAKDSINMMIYFKLKNNG